MSFNYFLNSPDKINIYKSENALRFHKERFQSSVKFIRYYFPDNLTLKAL